MHIIGIMIKICIRHFDSSFVGWTTCAKGTLLPMLLMFILSGCSNQSRTPTPDRSAARSRFAVTRPAAMEIAEAVLTRMYFTIDKFDPNSGVIITRPLPGAQFFEFWRNENIGTKNWINSNLHSIRRTVEINFVPSPAYSVLRKESKELGTQNSERRTKISCTVKIQRLSMPARQVTSSARAYEMFSRSNPTLQRLQLNPEQERKMAWVDMGTDTELEREIVKRIEKQCRKAWPSPLTTNNEQSTTKDEL